MSKNETVVTDSSGIKRDAKTGYFAKGHSGNPKGGKTREERAALPVPAREDDADSGPPVNLPPIAQKLKKLNKRFVDALYRDFQNYGTQAIEEFRQDDPSKYVQLVASFIPKEQTLNVNQRGQVRHEVEHVATIETSRFLGELLKQQRARENAIDVEVEDVVEED